MPGKGGPGACSCRNPGHLRRLRQREKRHDDAEDGVHGEHDPDAADVPPKSGVEGSQPARLGREREEARRRLCSGGQTGLTLSMSIL